MNEHELALDAIIEEHAIADEQHQRRYLEQLRRHPDCSDPGHPGCDECDQEGSDE
jgi:hypothetical protein